MEKFKKDDIYPEAGQKLDPISSAPKGKTDFRMVYYGTGLGLNISFLVTFIWPA